MLRNVFEDLLKVYDEEINNDDGNDGQLKYFCKKAHAACISSYSKVSLAAVNLLKYYTCHVTHFCHQLQ